LELELELESELQWGLKRQIGMSKVREPQSEAEVDWEEERESERELELERERESERELELERERELMKGRPKTSLNLDERRVLPRYEMGIPERVLKLWTYEERAAHDSLLLRMGYVHWKDGEYRLSIKGREYA